MALFIFQTNILQYEIPRVLISDRNTHFLNNIIEEWTTTYVIDNRKTHPIILK